MKRKGFTLIELLAVIVILAIIALIAVPIVMNIITKANKSAFQDTAYGIIKAGELYYADQLLEPNGMESDASFQFPNNLGNLQIKGSLPTGGGMIVNKEGKVAIAITNGKYCVRKDYNDNDVKIDEDIDNCNPGSSLIYTNGIMTSENKCIKSGTCSSGTKVNVKVNASENYDFYVINDETNKLTLIMNKNLGERMAWITREEYVSLGGNDSDYGDNGRNYKGPVTALKALEERTASWSNLASFTYTLSDDSGRNNYSPITRTNVKARMLTETEAFSDLIGCIYKGGCPLYLVDNLSDENTIDKQYGYWISTSHALNTYFGRTIRVNGVDADIVKEETLYGVRPVITVSKNQ